MITRECLLILIFLIQSLLIISRRKSEAFSDSTPSVLNTDILTTNSKQYPNWYTICEIDFSFQLYRNVSLFINHRRKEKVNMVFSPYAIYQLLNGIYEGSRDTSEDELTALLLTREDCKNQIPERRTETYNYLSTYRKSTIIPSIFLPYADKSIARGDLFKPVTYQQITRKSYDSNTNEINPYYVKLVTGIFLHRTYVISPDYSKLIKSTYDCHIQNINIDYGNSRKESLNTINELTSKMTDHQIEDILHEEAVTSNTACVATSAVAFIGIWEVPFLPSETRNVSFWVAFNKRVSIPTMKILEKIFNYVEDKLVQVIELPFFGKVFSMIIILPKAKSLDHIHRRLDEGALTRWLRLMKPETISILLLPKFDINHLYEHTQYSKVLRKMHVSSIFDDETSDLSAMAKLNPPQKAYIDEIYHKTRISVDEYGANVPYNCSIRDDMTMNLSNAKPAIMSETASNHYFTANSPFVFLIRDNAHGKIILMGNFLNPTHSS